MSAATHAAVKRPNPLSPMLMSPAERRAELCRLLALGLVRLLVRDRDETSDPIGESSLHSPTDRSGHANPTIRRPA